MCCVCTHENTYIHPLQDFSEALCDIQGIASVIFEVLHQVPFGQA